MQITRTRWFLPLFALALGVVMFAAQWIGGSPDSGLVSLGIMAAFGTLILFGGRSETVRGLRGDGRDERFWRMDLIATATSGMTVISVIIGAFVVELACGQDGNVHMAGRGRGPQLPDRDRRPALAAVTSRAAAPGLHGRRSALHGCQAPSVAGLRRCQAPAKCA